MVSELSFLLDLFLDPDCPCNMRDKLVVRIKDVEANLQPQARGPMPIVAPPPVPPNLQQAPSTLAAMVKHGDIAPVMIPKAEELPPVAVIAQTPEAAAALAYRNKAINDAMAGTIDKSTGRPKKFHS